ncbi:hypothetical protein TNCV_2016951 [Trichonephila clavipes]|nr:hypothetical protein TNCV_2016951 [Trichonephila clavipes]
MVSFVCLFAEILAGEYAGVGYLYELVPTSREDDRFGVIGKVLAFVRNGRQIFHQLSSKVIYTRPPYTKWGKKGWKKRAEFFHLVPVLLKEHLLIGQMQPMANIRDPTVHFHRAAVLTEHPDSSGTTRTNIR